MSVRPITREEYDDLAEREPYFRKRWGYLSIAGDIVRALCLSDHARGLEVGPGPSPEASFLRGADTLDLRGAPTFKHDAGVAPWPIPDAHYDLVVALQVWEHLDGRQRAAFAEAIRVARFVLLSFPYRWNSKSPEHHMVTREMIADWTLNRPPIVVRICKEPAHRHRLLALWAGAPPTA